MIQYSGGTYIDRTSTPVTRQDLCNLITQALSDAGWTTISGTPGSGADVTQESAAGNQGQKIRFRFFEPGSGTCAQVTMKGVGNTPVTGIGYINPASLLWRVIANKFTFFALQSGSSRRVQSLGYVGGGTLYVPTFIPLITGDNIGWWQCNGGTDTDATAHTSFRDSLRQYDGSNGSGRIGGIVQGNMMDTVGVTTNTGAISMVNWQGGPNVVDTAYRWHDDSAFVYEPLIVWGTTNVNDEAKIKGQLYDAMVVNGRYASETILPYDGHNWRAITDNASAAVGSTSTLFVRVS